MLQKQTVAPATLELLKAISSIAELKDFFLAGGTSLALQIGHRISVDLDFIGKRDFTTQEILDLLQDFKPLSIISQNKNILILNVKGVKVDFVNYIYPNISSPVFEEGVRLLSIHDIGAMKLAAIAGRGRKRDFFDLFFLLQHFTLKQLVEFYNRKFEDGSELMVARSITYFDDADEDEMVVLIDKSISWEETKVKIRSEVKTLFGF